jgi:ATPase
LIPQIIGRGGRTIEDIQRKFGVRIRVQEKGERTPERVKVDMEETKNHLILHVGEEFRNEEVEFFAEDSFLFKAKVGAKGEVKIDRDSQLAKQLEQLVKQGVTITAEILV